MFSAQNHAQPIDDFNSIQGVALFIICRSRDPILRRTKGQENRRSIFAGTERKFRLWLTLIVFTNSFLLSLYCIQKEHSPTQRLSSYISQLPTIIILACMGLKLQTFSPANLSTSTGITVDSQLASYFTQFFLYTDFPRSCNNTVQTNLRTREVANRKLFDSPQP